MAQSTAAQRRYISNLADEVGGDAFEEAFGRAAGINKNKGWGRGWETPSQAAKRLTRDACSTLIDELKTIGAADALDEEGDGEDNVPEAIVLAAAEGDAALSARQRRALTCPRCGAFGLEANTWEAWCGTCAFQVTATAGPRQDVGLFEAIRRAGERRYRAMTDSHQRHGHSDCITVRRDGSRFCPFTGEINDAEPSAGSAPQTPECGVPAAQGSDPA